MKTPRMKDGMQLLRRQLVRRLPTAADRAKRPPVMLTPRDREILTAVHLHGVLTAELVDIAFFPPAGTSRRSTSPALERLRALWVWGYLERIEPPVARVFGGREAFWYTLGARGVPVVAQQLGDRARPVQRRRVERMDDVFVHHDLNVAAFWAQLQALVRDSTVRQVWWAGDRNLRAQPLRVQAAGSRTWLPVLPDACFALEYPDRTLQCCILEVDMGTLSLARFARKLRALEAAQDQGVLERSWGYASCEMLVLTHSAGRLEQLWRTARRVVTPHRWSAYQFATFAVLDRHRFGGAVWRTLENTWVSLLHDDAFNSGPVSGPAGAGPVTVTVKA